MSPSSAPVNAGVVASLNGFGTPTAKPEAAKSLGAFDAPQVSAPTSVRSTDTGLGKAPPASKPTTENLSLDVATGSTKTISTPVAIPKVEWAKPTTVVQATGEAGKLPGTKAVITYVDDGDSLSTKSKDGTSLKCRIDSIDAPEIARPKYGKSGQAFGEESKKTLQEMVLNKEVTVRVSKPASTDKNDKNFGRSLCQIEIEGQNVDKKILQEGMAWLNKKYNTPELASAQSDAKAAKRGLWSDPDPINPAAFRYGKY